MMTYTVQLSSPEPPAGPLISPLTHSSGSVPVVQPSAVIVTVLPKTSLSSRNVSSSHASYDADVAPSGMLPGPPEKTTGGWGCVWAARYPLAHTTAERGRANEEIFMSTPKKK